MYLFIAVSPSVAERAPASILRLSLLVTATASFSWAEGHPAGDYISQLPLQLDETT